MTSARARVGFDIFANDVTRTGVESAKKNMGSLAGSTSLLRGGAIAAAGALAALPLLDVAESANRLRTRIATATKETGDFAAVYATLQATVQETGTDFEAAVDNFQAFSRLRDDLGITNANALQFGKTVQQLGVIGGASTEAMKRGLLQLNQGLAGGVIRAEEFNSIVENIPELTSRLAREFGKTQGELRQMVLDGKLFSEDVAIAVLNISKDVNQQFSELPPTIERAGNALGAAFGVVVSRADEAVGATRFIAEIIDGVADYIGGSSNDSIEEKIADRLSDLEELVESQRVIQRQFDAGKTSAFKEFFGIDAETQLKELNAEIAFTAEVIRSLQAALDERTATAGIAAAAEEARAKKEAAAAEAERLKAEAKAEKDRAAKAEREAETRKKEIEDRIAENRDLFVRLREDRLSAYAQDEQLEAERYERERAEIEARKALAAEQNPASLDQQREFNAALEDLRLVHVARLAEINDEAVFRDVISAEESFQLLLQTRELQFQEELAQKLGFQSLEEAEIEAQRRSFQDRQLAMDLQYNAKSLQIIRKAIDLEILWNRNKGKALSEGALMLTQELAGQSKTLFKINQIAGIANAVVSTAQGAAKALELGFPLGLIAAAAITAAGVAQIQTIRSASFEGGGGGSSGGGLGGLSGGGGFQAAAPTEVPDIPTVSNQERNATSLNITLSAADNIGEKIIEGIAIEVNERDATFINPGSLQANVIQGGATI